jgi:flagella basal body P-ring formation protein FlgA
MMKTLTLLVSLLAALATAGTGGHAVAAAEAILKNAVIIEGRYVTLGDLFENAGARTKTNVAYAPSPGKRAIFDARWLYRVARAHGLKWRPLNLKTRAVVERAGQEIHRAEIVDALMSEFKDRGLDDDIEIDFGGRSMRLYVAANRPATVGIESLNHDPNTGRFVATISVPAGDPAAKRLRITGRVFTLVAVPVLAKKLYRGDVIRKHHLEWKKIRRSKVLRQTITEAEQLIGMAAKRLIGSNRPIRLAQVRRPLLIAKGGIVTIRLNYANMSLTAQGRSLDEGSLGDVVRITNSQSKKIVEARVTGANRVRVQGLGASTIN